MPKACQYQAQERLFSIYCWDIKDRGNRGAALEELGGRPRSVGSVGQIKVEDVYGVKSGSAFRKLVGKFSWARRRENKNAEWERSALFSCIYRQLDHPQTWCSVRSCNRSPCLPCPCDSCSGNDAVVCAGLFWAWRLFQAASARPSSSVLSQMGFVGVNLAHGFNMFRPSNSKEQWRKTYFTDLPLKVSIHCIRHLCLM